MSKRIEIENIKKVPFRTSWNELMANIIDDGRFFSARSFNSEFACDGIIINYEKNIENKNPPLRILNIYKKHHVEEDENYDFTND